MSGAAAPTDFLSRVALPALGAMPLVRPRLPSLFENQQADAMDEGPDDPFVTVQENAPVWRALAAPPPMPAIRELLVAAQQPQDRASAKPVADHAPQRDEAIPPLPVAAAVQPLVERVTPLPRESHRPEMRDELPGPPAPRSRAKRASEPSDVATQAASVAPDTRKPDAISTGPVAAPVVALPVSAAPLARPNAQPLVMPAPLPPARRQEAMTIQLPPAPPAITITIGRIDIRAASPQPATSPPPPRAAKPQPQSLDDYLKHRTGGA